MPIILIIIFIIAIANIMLGYIAYTRKKTLFSNKIFLLFTVLMSSWLLSNYLLSLVTTNVQLGTILNGIAYTVGLLTIYCALLFSLSYPRESTFLENKKRLILISTTVLLFSLFSATDLVTGGVILGPEGTIAYGTAPLEIVYTLLASTLLLLMIGRYIVMLRKLTGSERLQAIYIMFAFGVGIVIALFANLVFPYIGITVDYSLFAPIASFIVVSLISYAIVKHQLFDIRLVIARTIAYGASISIIVAIFVIGSLLLGNRIAGGAIDAKLLLYYSTISVIIALTFQPVKHYFDKFSNRLFYRDAYDGQEFLNTINAKIVKSNDLYTLLNEVSEDIKSTIKVDNANFYIDSSAAIDFHTAGTNTALFAKTEWSELLQDINKLDKKVITSESLEVEEDTIKLMRKLNIELVLKMTSKDENVGYLLLSERKSGTNFGLQDIQVLEILADELAITVQNAVQLEQIAQFNVTLQKKINNATAELQQSNEKLVKLDEAKDEFISMASHQLRTPLTSVKGYISMILEGDAGEINDTQKKFLDQAYISSQRMVYLIADLLNVSRLKTGKFVIEKSPTYLPDVIESEVSQLYGTAEARDLKMIFHKPKEFPTIDLDETKIRQVIMNFADNAIYYTPHGGKITIELKKLKNSIEYTVTDTGIGVPKAEQHHLFNKFYRAANAKKARPDGTGLGLYMAKKVVVAQGGAIIFKTTEGKGSTFGFSFPLPKDEPHEEEK